MYVTIVHKVHDPEKFWSTAREALEGGTIPSDLTVRGVFPDSTGTKCVCLWEAPSVGRMQEYMEEVLGAFSENDYFEVSPENAIGLPG